MKAAGWPEPARALDGGSDGLDLVRRLIREARSRLSRGGWLFLEADPEQMPEIEAELLRAGFSEVRVERDLGGRDRIIGGKRVHD